MDFLSKFSKLIHQKTKAQGKAAPSGDTSNMELPPPLTGIPRCSDDQCPCDEFESTMPPARCYLYIAPQVVEFRKDCLSLKEFYTKIEAVHKGTDIGLATGGKNIYFPVVVCEQGARLRNIDLCVAAQDFDSWLHTGRVPCRPTPVTNT